MRVRVMETNVKKIPHVEFWKIIKGWSTVISAWWRSNMPFQRLSGRLNYYITRWRQEVSELETRCGRESHHPAEGALGTPSEFWDQLVRRCWNENMSQRGWAPRPPFEQPRRTRTTHGNVRRVWGGQYIAALFSLQLPLTRKPYK